SSMRRRRPAARSGQLAWATFLSAEFFILGHSLSHAVILKNGDGFAEVADSRATVSSRYLHGVAADTWKSAAEFGEGLAFAQVKHQQAGPSPGLPGFALGVWGAVPPR